MMRYLEYKLEDEEYAALEVQPGCFSCILPVGQPSLKAAKRFVERARAKTDPETGKRTGNVLFTMGHIKPYATDVTVVELEVISRHLLSR